MRTFEWPIEDIVTAHPDLYLEHCAVMAVALMNRRSASPCEFLVECEGFRPPALGDESRFLLRVAWDERTATAAARVWLAEQPKPIIERTAVALAALSFAHLIPDGRMRVTEQGQRADYWLPKLRCALEISGTEQGRELPRRRGEKTAQMLANPRRWNGYVFVCYLARDASSFTGLITANRSKKMPRPKAKPGGALIDHMLGEASWLLSHAQALTDYGRQEEAAAEWARAAACEEQASCLLDADGQEREAAIHRVSAASCCEKLGQYARAVTLLRAAHPAPLPDDYRVQVEQQLARALARAYKDMSRAFARRARKQTPAIH